MNDSSSQFDRLSDLTQAICDNRASEDDFAELDAILLADQAARRYFLDSCQLRAALRFELRANRAVQNVQRQITTGSSIPPVSAYGDATEESPSGRQISVSPPPVYGTFGYLSSGWPMAYLLATVIVGLGISIAGVVRVSRPSNVVHSELALDQRSTVAAKTDIVGRITGIVDCQWTGSSDQRHLKSTVSLGEQIDLQSGLLEITYETGAKVILEGPVTYEAESRNGGFMSVGRLTGRVDVEAAKGFSIRTPSATIIDLGTEFGVEVDRQGATTSHVFRGTVKIQPISAEGKPEGTGRVLHATESAKVVRMVDGKTTAIASAIGAAQFVRKLPSNTVKRFDLADVVAGGDGFSGRRGRGIDPSNGQPTESTLAAPKNTNANDFGRFRVASDGKYHRAKAFPFVDGVFIPNGRQGGVQVDSAGHLSEFFTACNVSTGSIWAGGAIPALSSSMPPVIAALLPSLSPSQKLVPTKLGAIDYASKSHALIFLPSNNGITFDLDAIRRANPGFKPVRFVATVGNTEIASEDGLEVVYADIWVLVDGQVRFRRREINKCSGVFPIAFSIAKEDRFLTLVSTDGGNDAGFDWILFGDPVLELIPAVPERQTIPRNN